jgi:hypothetical protein
MDSMEHFILFLGCLILVALSSVFYICIIFSNSEMFYRNKLINTSILDEIHFPP